MKQGIAAATCCMCMDPSMCMMRHAYMVHLLPAWKFTLLMPRGLTP